ncbi:hypothetical protein evm_006261 [Chilo suppressalis]|nr:hypothetical protein evm_006261 [Chilo suppressalis]
MYEFQRTNKITGVHWLKDAIEDIQVNVKLKPKESIMTLPKFEDYTNEAPSANIESFETAREYTFAWQEKVFSLWELQRYSNVHNCTTDVQLTYHNMLNTTDYEPSKIFSYIHEDCYLSLPSDSVCFKSNILELNSCFGRLNLNDKIGEVLNTDNGSMGHLFRSEENIDNIADGKWRAMHIVLDNSQYDEDSNLILKQEAILLSLYHNVKNNYLLVSPDSNNLEMNPYSVETRTGLQLEHVYAVDLQLHGDGENAEELSILLEKLRKKWEKMHKHLVNFSAPPLGKKLHYVALEILTASDFEMDNLYIEFNIKLPEGVQSSDGLHGRTHVSKSFRTDDRDDWNFGHLITLALETIDASDPPTIQLFFEVISTDWWGRHRTEGYSYLPLTLEPGTYTKMLSCSRPEESDTVEAESRRFFVGGCHLIKDLDVLANPHLQDANFVYTTTGSIQIRWSVVSHSPIPGHSETTKESVAPSTSASALLRGAEAVLRQYKRAKARLAAATKDLGGSGDGPEDG